jgi:hypothetical protein
LTNGYREGRYAQYANLISRRIIMLLSCLRKRWRRLRVVDIEDESKGVRGKDG